LSALGSLYDTSVWVALAFSAHPLHLPAKAEFATASAANPALFCRATQQSFLRLLTTPTIAKAYGVSTPINHDALSILDGFMGSSSVGSVDEPAKIFARWRSLADLPTASAKCWMDAYLAAFALQAGLKFVTGDNDFKNFAGLNPKLIVPPPPAAPVVASPS